MAATKASTPCSTSRSAAHRPRSSASCSTASSTLTDHTTHFYVLGGPDFVVGPERPGGSATSSASSARSAWTIGRQGDQACARDGRRAHQHDRRQADPSRSAACPAASARPSTRSSATGRSRHRGASVEFAKFTLQLFDDIVLANTDYVEPDHARHVHPQDLQHGHGGREQPASTSTTARSASSAPTARSTPSTTASDYLDYVAEHVEPWSYLKFPYLKKVGWKGFVDGKDSGVYKATPLGAAATPPTAWPRRWPRPSTSSSTSTLGGKPVHTTLANALGAAGRAALRGRALGRAGHRSRDHRHRTYRDIPTATPTEGVGCVEAPRGTLYHHYKTDDKRHRHQGQPDRRHDQQQRRRSPCRVKKAAKGLITRRQGQRGPAEHGRDGLPRLRPVLRLRHAHPARPDAAARSRSRARPRARSSPASRGTCDAAAPRSCSAWATRSCLTTGSGCSLPGGSRPDRCPPGVEVAQSEVGGLRLLELVRGFTRVIIIDALKSPAEAGREPGEVVRYEAKDFKGGHRYGSAHSIGLDTASSLDTGSATRCRRRSSCSPSRRQTWRRSARSSRRPWPPPPRGCSISFAARWVRDRQATQPPRRAGRRRAGGPARTSLVRRTTHRQTQPPRGAGLRRRTAH